MENLGPMLLRTGLINKETYIQALSAQEVVGLPLQEVLVREGALSEEALVEVFRKQMMIPKLRRDDLQGVPPDIRALVPGQMAKRFRVVPVRLDMHGHLILAMANPADNHAADELTHYTKLYVVRCVAPVSLVNEFIVKLYGAFPPEQQTGGTPPLAGSPPSAAPHPSPAPVAPAPPPSVGSPLAPPPAAPDAQTSSLKTDSDGDKEPPLSEEDVVLLTKIIRPSPKLRPSMDTPIPTGGDNEAGAARDLAEDEEIISLTQIKAKPQNVPEAPRGETKIPAGGPASKGAPTQAADPGPAPKKTDSSKTLSGQPFAPPEKPASSAAWSAPKKEKSSDGKLSKTPTLLGIPTISSESASSQKHAAGAWRAPRIPKSQAPEKPNERFESAVKKLQKAKFRDQVGAILCDYLHSSCSGAAFFVIQKSFLNGREIRGEVEGGALIRELFLPLGPPSRLKNTVSSRLPYRGPPGEGAPDRLLQKAFGYAPKEVVLFPVSLRDRVVALLYGDRLGPEFRSQEISELLPHAEAAYERLLLAKKKGRGG